MIIHCELLLKHLRSVMGYGPQAGGGKSLGWMCIFALLLAGCAGAIHECPVGPLIPSDAPNAFADATPGHAFCAVCALTHSPLLLATQVSLSPVYAILPAVVIVPVLDPRLQPSLSLYVRPPPAC